VSREPSEAPDAVELKDAAAVAIASDLGITEPADEVAAFLSGLPTSVRLFAAVDETGVSHATSACHVFGEYAQIFFVNTEPAWRRRGIGEAMTLAALRSAAALGARRAFLHATDDGASIYTRLGFEPVGQLTRYSSTG
jgi:predicted GNAT family acetyltransferase